MIGQIVGDVYVSYRRPDQVFRLYHSFGISKSILIELENCKIEKIQFSVKEWNCVYEATVNQFLYSALEFRDSLGDKSKHVRLEKMNKVLL